MQKNKKIRKGANTFSHHCMCVYIYMCICIFVLCNIFIVYFLNTILCFVYILHFFNFYHIRQNTFCTVINSVGGNALQVM